MSARGARHGGQGADWAAAGVLAAGLLAAGLPALTGTGAAPAGAVTTKVWGIGGIREQNTVQALEARVGRQFGAVRVFLFWDEAFPTSYHTWLATPGGRR